MGEDVSQIEPTIERPPIQRAARSLSQQIVGLVWYDFDRKILTVRGNTTIRSWQGYPVESESNAR